MISKEQFLAIKKMKADGVPVAAIARKVAVSEPVVRKWTKLALVHSSATTSRIWISAASSSLASCVFARKPEKPMPCTA